MGHQSRSAILGSGDHAHLGREPQKSPFAYFQANGRYTEFLDQRYAALQAQADYQCSVGESRAAGSGMAPARAESPCSTKTKSLGSILPDG